MNLGIVGIVELLQKHGIGAKVIDNFFRLGNS
jgi:hypothetical protein